MRLLLLAGLVLVVACSDDDDGSGPNDVVDIEGNWTFSASASNPELDVSCSLTGDIAIVQNGDQFSGTVSNSEGLCTGPGGQTEFDGDGQIDGGTIINEDNVQFDDNFCSYSGSATGNPANEVDGEVTCVFSVSGTDVEMEGTWQMDR